jgi:hypothetical protein
MELLAETPEKVTEGSTKLFGCLDVAQGMQLSRPKANVSAFFVGKPKLTDAMLEVRLGPASSLARLSVSAP